jgi:hypothetical protein
VYSIRIGAMDDVEILPVQAAMFASLIEDDVVNTG